MYFGEYTKESVFSFEMEKPFKMVDESAKEDCLKIYMISKRKLT